MKNKKRTTDELTDAEVIDICRRQITSGNYVECVCGKYDPRFPEESAHNGFHTGVDRCPYCGKELQVVSHFSLKDVSDNTDIFTTTHDEPKEGDTT